jgi:hypothetical protein
MNHITAVFPLLLAATLSAQISEFEQSADQPAPAVAPAADTITDELPAPLPDPQAAQPRAEVSTSTPRIELDPVGEDIAAARKLTGIGTALYFTGLALEYGVSLPLQLVGSMNYNDGMAIGGLIAGLAATGFQISGTTRSGIGASMAYDWAVQRGINPERNSNWGYCQAGWAFTSVATVMNLILNIGGANGLDYSTASVLSIIGLGSSIAADVFWCVAVGNAAKYARNIAKKNGEESNISVYPVYSAADGSFGAVMQWAF